MKPYNKAVYTTASVAYGWAGAVTQVLLPFGGSFALCKGPMDGQMDGQTVGWMDWLSDL